MRLSTQQRTELKMAKLFYSGHMCIYPWEMYDSAVKYRNILQQNDLWSDDKEFQYNLMIGYYSCLKNRYNHHESVQVEVTPTYCARKYLTKIKELGEYLCREIDCKFVMDRYGDTYTYATDFDIENNSRTLVFSTYKFRKKDFNEYDFAKSIFELNRAIFKLGVIDYAVESQTNGALTKEIMSYQNNEIYRLENYKQSVVEILSIGKALDNTFSYFFQGNLNVSPSHVDILINNIMDNNVSDYWLYKFSECDLATDYYSSKAKRYVIENNWKMRKTTVASKFYYKANKNKIGKQLRKGCFCT